MAEKNMGEYGNNYFILQGGDARTGRIDGILTELPPISMSTDWVAGPYESINSFFEELLNNDFVEFLAINGNAAAGQNTSTYHRYLPVGENNSRTYNSCSRLSFDLKWRVYAGQRIGTQKTSTFEDCMKFIKNLVPSDEMSKVSINNLKDNVIAAAEGAGELIKLATKEYSDESEKKIKAEDDAATMANKFKNNNASTDNPWADIEDDTVRDHMSWASNALAAVNPNSRDSGLTTYNFRGATLCTLHIYPKLFPRGIPVNIKSFNVTPSKEWNKDKEQNYYYDFEVNCEVNEIPSSPQWLGTHFTALPQLNL